MQNNYLNHKRIYKTKKIEIMCFEFTPRRIGGAMVAGNGEGGARDSPEQWHGVVTTFVAKWWLWWTVAKWCDGGATEGATVAESGCFSRVVWWRSNTGDASFVDGGAIGDGGQRRAQS